MILSMPLGVDKKEEEIYEHLYIIYIYIICI